MSLVPPFLQETRRNKMSKTSKKDMTKKSEGLTEKQKKLPPALQKAILKKKK